jgi:hypothetical protein
VHLINLFHRANRDAIANRHHEKVVSWLAAADPPVPRAVAWKVLETGRERFRLARARCVGGGPWGGRLPSRGRVSSATVLTKHERPDYKRLSATKRAYNRTIIHMRACRCSRRFAAAAPRCAQTSKCRAALCPALAAPGTTSRASRRRSPSWAPYSRGSGSSRPGAGRGEGGRRATAHGKSGVAPYVVQGPAALLRMDQTKSNPAKDAILSLAY